MFAYIYCMKKVVICIILWSLVIGWMGIIFYFSHQTSTVSSALSKDLAKDVYESVDLTPERFEHKPDEWLIAHYKILVRKVAHLVQFFVLGILLTLALSMHISSINKVTVYSFTISALYAIGDEIHQSFIPGRGAKTGDVIIDLVGILLGCMLIWCTVKLISRFKKAKSEKISN